jgi:GAF domain-containing protein
MEPVPETLVALGWFKGAGSPTERTLQTIAAGVVEAVPTCVGLSLTRVKEGITLTLAAAGLETRGLDAMQYVDDGPCVDAVDLDKVITADLEDALSEERWSLFARASAAAGVKSSLSLPIPGPDGDVVGGLNLYASEPGAFRGHENQIAELAGAWAPGAVHDADLTFSTREVAARAPQSLADLTEIDAAVEVLAQSMHLDIPAAAQRLANAAGRAGLTLIEVARAIIRVRDLD